MAMGPNPCVRVCVSVSRVPAGRMERESLPATRRGGWLRRSLSFVPLHEKKSLLFFPCRWTKEKKVKLGRPMGPSKRGGGEGAAGKCARAGAGGQAAQDGVPDTAGELSAKGPAGGKVGQRAAVGLFRVDVYPIVQDPAAQDPAPARGKGSDDLTDPDEHGLHGIDRAHELLLALQNRTGNGPDKDEPGLRCVTAGRLRSAMPGDSHGCLGLRRGEDRPPAAGRMVTDASRKPVRTGLRAIPPRARRAAAVCSSLDGVTAGRGNEPGRPGVRGAEGVGARLRCVRL